MRTWLSGSKQAFSDPAKSAKRAFVFGGVFDERVRQRRVVVDRDQLPRLDALVDLLEERQRHVAELVREPVVRRAVEVLVAPQRRLTRAVGEAGELADLVVALAMGHADHARDQLRQQPGRAVAAPLRVQVAERPGGRRHDVAQLELRHAVDDRVQRDGVGDHDRDVGHQPGDRGHHERGRALAVDDRPHLVGLGVLEHRAHRDGWSWTAASSSVQRRRGMSIDARQFSSHTSQPSSTSTSTSVRPDGARKMLARTPAPCTSSTGPLVGACSPRTWIRFSSHAVARGERDHLVASKHSSASSA